ncbi:ornithine cyclodeaminase family protein [Novosphingobium sp. 1949]|uniref:Ornithine cyclodeaminase family protein n=1 Tax=Novosphingobium organovorum TaxID=2930092 RepID=A0ABT0BD80_9SPHN|nr:ornithine cyclodeaminase family protein [Novosphingobium organovorum]MCJ2182934.1 ornithine cyclodeaminase family protein [Novosphingobium organovorum]
MKFISEEQSSALITHELAYAAAREALVAAVEETSTVFPAVIAHGSQAHNRFTVKSGASADLAGLKVGSFWPGNPARGLPRHNSITLLFDQDEGRIAWVIESGTVNAYRTAAVDAVAADRLARADASTLTLFGAGNQAFYECLAVSRVRPIRQVLVVARDPAKAQAFIAKLRDAGLTASACAAQEACQRADIIVTATPARAPLFDAEWVRPGTHVAGMGSDAAGKQELPSALFETASLYCDLPEQARVIGEFQHFGGDPGRLTALGAVLTGKAPARTSESQITVFDSSGIALQDLYTARHLIAAFQARNP